jgi:hypothetical protein
MPETWSILIIALDVVVIYALIVHGREMAGPVGGLGRRFGVPRGGNYEIRVKGRLSDSLLTAFEGMRASVEPVETVLHGPVQDQAALHGLLDRIQSLGLELIEVRRLPDPPAEPEITRPA